MVIETEDDFRRVWNEVAKQGNGSIDFYRGRFPNDSYRGFANDYWYKEILSEAIFKHFPLDNLRNRIRV